MKLLTAILLLAGVTIVTYLTRAGMILALADRTLPEPVIRALRNVGPAVLAALVVTLIANPDEPNQGLELAEVAGAVATVALTFRFRNLIPGLTAGMIVFWLIRAIS